MRNVFIPEKKAPKPSFDFATIGGIYEDGIALIFDGQTQASTKHYRCNTAVTFAVGQRVKILHTSGTYIVEYPVGLPDVGGGE